MGVYKRAAALLLLLAAGIQGFAQESVTLEQALEAAVNRLAGNIPKDSLVAVINFDTPARNLSDYIVNYLIDGMSAKGGLKIVDRDNVDNIMDQTDFQNSVYGDEAYMTAIGQIPGVQTIVTGSFQAGAEGSYILQVTANTFPTNLRQASYREDVRLSPSLAKLLGIPWIDESWKNKWLFIGAWGGYGYSWAAAGQVSLQLARAFALTFEAGAGAFMRTVTVKNAYYGDREEDEQITAFMAALFPTLTIRPRWPAPFSFEFYAGPYYNMIDDFGLAAGASIGYNLGPGILFADFRYGFMHHLGLEGFEHRMMSGGLGYKIVLINNKKL
jgi:hypothetical protein